MTEAARARPVVQVVRVDASNWRVYRQLRLAALRGAPRAFWTTYDEAAARADEEWERMVGQLPTWLAVLGDRAVGSVSLFHSPEQPEDDCFLVGMWVDPAARGNGVGEVLARTVVDAAGEQGRSRVVLEVAHENAAAIALYERVGFVATGRTGAMPHDPSITEFEMELVLPP